MYISVRLCFLFLFSASGDHRDLHSFPTRRSSDLNRMCLACTSMDALDHDILRHLQENGRMSNLDLARAIGLSPDRKSTRLNSSHLGISYAVFCLKKKTKAKETCNTISRAVNRQI